MMVVACGGHTEPPRPPTVQRLVPAAWPPHLVAVLDVDLPRLRQSPLWPFLRQGLAAQSIAADACLLDQARRLSVTIHYVTPAPDDDGPGSAASAMAYAAIYQGVDPKMARSCVMATRASTKVSPPPPPSNAVLPSCHVISAAAAVLADCDGLPLSALAALQRSAQRLADARSEALATVCAEDRAAWTQAASHCGAPPATTSTEDDELSASRLSWYEGHDLWSTTNGIVLFTKPGHVATVDASRGGYERGLQVAIETAAAFERADEWLASTGAASVPPGVVTLAALPERLNDLFPEGLHLSLPIRLDLSLDTARDLAVKGKMSGVMSWTVTRGRELFAGLREEFGVTEEVLSLPATCTVGTAGPQDRLAACTAALEKRRRLSPSAESPLALADALDMCVATPLAKSFLDCVGQATSKETVDACVFTMDAGTQAKTEALVFRRPVCGSGEVSIEGSVPLSGFAMMLRHRLKDLPTVRDLPAP